MSRGSASVKCSLSCFNQNILSKIGMQLKQKS